MAFTIYNNPPTAVFAHNKAVTSATDGYYDVIQAVPVGTRCVQAWVDITVASGAAGAAGALVLRQGTTDLSQIGAIDSNATGFYPASGNLTTAIAGDPIAADGNLSHLKDGTGVAMVYTAFALLIRPDMNPA
jgi:hypothetical protein